MFWAGSLVSLLFLLSLTGAVATYNIHRRMVDGMEAAWTAFRVEAGFRRSSGDKGETLNILLSTYRLILVFREYENLTLKYLLTLFYVFVVIFTLILFLLNFWFNFREDFGFSRKELWFYGLGSLGLFFLAVYLIERSLIYNKSLCELQETMKELYSLIFSIRKKNY